MEIDYSRITQGLSAGITDNPVVNLMVRGQTESQSTMSIVYAYWRLINIIIVVETAYIYLLLKNQANKTMIALFVKILSLFATLLILVAESKRGT